ncbi:MAG TPA: hypothetical protein ENK55_09385, partial [Actinobacteria bacterium]|nr:hypothetical protein [Actinomycetota bacterium]
MRASIHRRGGLLALAVAVAATVAVTTAPADATPPGSRGDVVYEYNDDLWTMNKYGNLPAPLYTSAGSIERAPAWSPDGTKVAFSSDKSGPGMSGPNIWVVNADGTGATPITTEDHNAPGSVSDGFFDPSWSPDGQWLVFSSLEPFSLTGTATAGTTATTLIDATATFISDGVEKGMTVDVPGVGTSTVASVDSETKITLDVGLVGLSDGSSYEISKDRYRLYLVKADGTGLQKISVDLPANAYYSDVDPDWSPKGDKIAFGRQVGADDATASVDLYVADIDPTAATPLSNLTNLTPDPGWVERAEHPSWSPDATRIAFQSQKSTGSPTPANIWTIGADGTSPLQLTEATSLADEFPSWSPDGGVILFQRPTPQGMWLFVIGADGSWGLDGADELSGDDDQYRGAWRRDFVATDDVYAVAVGGSVNAAAPGVLANDEGLAGNPLVTASVVTPPSHAASFTFNPDGSFTYTHDGTPNDDTFTYQVTDAGGNLSNVATVTLDAPTNAAPVAMDDAYSVERGETLTVAAPGVLQNDTDAEDGTPGTAVLVSGPSHATSFTLNGDGSFTYVHDGTKGTTDTFTYKAKDSGAMESNVATVTLTITSKAHTVGLVDPAQGKWYLYDANGVLVSSFYFGNPGDYPIYGDWDCDGVETPGLY